MGLFPDKEDKFNENVIFKKYANDFDKRQNEIEKIYDEKNRTMQNEIKELSEHIKVLKNNTHK